MKALALGIQWEIGVDNSMEVDASLSAQQIADLIEKEFGMNCDDIFMIVNGKDCPDVDKHWQRYTHFGRK